MDGSQFDAWTRRRFATGGVLASLITLGSLSEAETKKKKRKKRCRKLGKVCKTSGNKNKKKCCGSLKCDTVAPEVSTQTHCCRALGSSCTGEFDCCGGFCCNDECVEVCFSDRALKANFGSVDAADMLARVRELPISTWNYTSDDAAVRHIGPMAQDFAASFGVGADDRHIHPIDGQGVALAAIQGIITELDALRTENARLAERVAALEG